MPTLRIVAAVIRNPQGHWLLVRKRGTTAFMQPGGKLEPGESPDQALVRELKEELDLAVGPADLTHVGRFTARAANEAGFMIDADVYTAPSITDAVPLAELEEARWVDLLASGALELAPLLTDHLLPLLRDGRL
ncbi:NUDIX hydrolase [Symbioplanes lichenis]|uniref:NUDIX hydrolase n=1 Tax=Symbioplanes lichenis TaxID=1629072 RepID=UPI00273994EF|nr:NUDIX domain-containing protein [Actinoplanes lichenis]